MEIRDTLSPVPSEVVQSILASLSANPRMKSRPYVPFSILSNHLDGIHPRPCSAPANAPVCEAIYGSQLLDSSNTNTCVIQYQCLHQERLH